MEGFFQMRNENVIEVDTESPQEEETGHQRKGHNVAAISEGFDVGADCEFVPHLQVHSAASPSEIEKAAVNRIVHSSDERNFIGAQKKGQGSYLVRLSHPADRLRGG